MNVLIVDLLEFVNAVETAVGTGRFTFLAQNLVGPVNLVGKLTPIGVFVDNIAAYDKPMLFIDYDLPVITGVIALSAMYLRAVVIGRIDRGPLFVFDIVEDISTLARNAC